MSEEVEEWRPWPRDTAYEVSNMGRVRGPSGKVLAQEKRKKSGKRTRCFVDVRGSRTSVPRMVWQTWRKNDASDVTHVDGNPLNNRARNLARYRLPDAEGMSEEPRIPLSEADAISAMFMRGETFRDIASRYNVSAPTARKVLLKAGVDIAELRGKRTAEKKAARSAGQKAKTVAKYQAAGRVKLCDMTAEQRWEYGRNRHLRREFGISFAEFRLIVMSQKGKCALCGDPLPEWEQGCERRKDGRHPVVDHCHRSDGSASVRGILHATCNAAIGLLGDDPENARRAARYLERTRHARPMRHGPLQQGLGGL